MIDKTELTLFDNALHIYEFQHHAKLKEKHSKICEDIANTNMNTNSRHHYLVYQSPTGLQLNYAFKELLEGEELNHFCNQKHCELMPGSDLVFAITNMWLTIVPSAGMINYHSHKGLFHGMYFLHAENQNGMLLFNSTVSDAHFESIGNPTPNRFNSPTNNISINEGYIYLIPSFINHSSTANESQETRVSLNFTIDLVEK